MDFTSPFHLLVIIFVIMLLFGGKKIPELMKGIGQGVREFKKASTLNDDPDKKEPEVKDSEIKVSENK